MRWHQLIIAIALAATVPMCAYADTHSPLSYTGGRFPVYVNGNKFIVGVHKKYDTLLMQQSLGSRVVDVPLQTWRRIAETFVGPAGCGISKVEAITVAGATWEATYVCPAGVDLHQLVKEQRKALKEGTPLSPRGADVPGRGLSGE